MHAFIRGVCYTHQVCPSCVHLPLGVSVVKARHRGHSHVCSPQTVHKLWAEKRGVYLNVSGSLLTHKHVHTHTQHTHAYTHVHTQHSEGNHVRLSGQDVERGTFSHRCVAVCAMFVFVRGASRLLGSGVPVLAASATS